MKILRDYAGTLPGLMTADLTPRRFPDARLLALNEGLAHRLGLDPGWLRGPDGIALLSGGMRPDGLAPVAMAYAGHQFGHFNPTLGDGRAMLVGEIRDGSGALLDVHLKGSGPTPYGRRGDGWAALGPVLREYVVSEAMAALGIPTTRALAAVATGWPVMREAVLPGAVIARVARAHIRVGTFEFAAATGDVGTLRALADYTIGRLYPWARDTDAPYAALFGEVVVAQARLVARWMLVGFVHGVMNTDNTSIAGETIDFGPCAFLDAYDPGQVFSAIDRDGRYAFGRQPDMALWNLMRLAEAMLPLLGADEDAAIAVAQEILGGFSGVFGEAHLAGWRAKLGLVTAADGDAGLISAFLVAMRDGRADMTLACRALCGVAAGGDEQGLRALFADGSGIGEWLVAWRARLGREAVTPERRAALMRAVNPRIVPRNHRIEAMIVAALAGDFGPFERLTAALARPFDEGEDAFGEAPAPHERVSRTFCGT